MSAWDDVVHCFAFWFKRRFLRLCCLLEICKRRLERVSNNSALVRFVLRARAVIEAFNVFCAVSFSSLCCGVSAIDYF